MGRDATPWRWFTLLLARDSALWCRELQVQAALVHLDQAAGITLEMLEDGYVRNPLAPKVLFEGRRLSIGAKKFLDKSDIPLGYFLEHSG